ncbi:hypothetical protein HU730_009275 [Pseudomonas sp. SWRI22]|uniref:hypothetical protein n=1 Tax=Pseudomonas sp. SWRI22 TaxID=2745513 RepID=UPI0016453547|nr:hypothetical protein [Pseudomonas sp. SWRI22]MBV4510245.1 hypothetical protein [Pseudomonas sp. SWRI22]
MIVHEHVLRKTTLNRVGVAARGTHEDRDRFFTGSACPVLPVDLADLRAQGSTAWAVVVLVVTVSEGDEHTGRPGLNRVITYFITPNKYYEQHRAL